MIMHAALYRRLTSKLPVTIPSLSNSLTYTGGSQSPSWDNFYDNLMEISGQTSGTNAGEYEVTFSLNSKRLYLWSDGTKDDKTSIWTINKALNTITLNPTSLSLTYYDNTGTVSVSYLGDGLLTYSIDNDNIIAIKNKNNIIVTASETGNSVVTVNVSEGTNYLTASKTFDVAIDMVKNFTITAIVGEDGGGTASGGGTIREGASITVVAMPSNGYRFGGWMIDDEIVSTETIYTFTPIDDTTVIAVFEEIPIYTVTVIINPENLGTVTGAGLYHEGETCTLIANIENGNEFVGWQKNGLTISTETTYSFVVESNIELVAKFKEIEVYNITLDAYPLDAGIVTGAGAYLRDELVIITATPEEGYRFVHWVEDFEPPEPAESGIIGTGKIGQARIEEEVI